MSAPKTRSALLVIFASLVLAACSFAGSAPTLGPGAAQPQLRQFARSVHLYVANSGNNTVTAYDIGGSRAGKLVRKITSGISHPTALAFDQLGNLYVANYPTNTVTVYAPNSNAVVRTMYSVYKSGHITGLAVDSANNVYVARYGHGPRHPGDISVYAPNSKKALRNLACYWYMTGFVLDKSANVYAGCATPFGLPRGPEVDLFFPAGSSDSTESFSDYTNWPYYDYSGPTGLAVDGNGNFFVANDDIGSNADAIDVFVGGKSDPVKTFDAKGCPTVLAVDSSGNLYASDGCSGGILVYAATTLSLLRTIPETTNAMVFDRRGNLYTAEDSAVEVYAPGTTAPLRTFTHGIETAAALAFGP